MEPSPSGADPLTDGFHLVIDALKLNDVATVYGVVGIPITDLARLAQASGIRYIGFRHESNAGHAAAAAGFLTRKPGVCLTVSGPGFLNGMVALANATVNCFPMVHIAGSSTRAIVDLQRGDYEELDQLAVARPVAKASYRIDRIEDIGRGIARAIRTAVSGRPGGVYLDIPGDVLAQTIDASVGAATLWKVADPAPRQTPAPDAVERAVDLLSSAERPLIVLGKGAAYAQADEAIGSFVTASGIPFVPMSMAKGLLPDDHPLCASAARSLALSRADVVLLIGARLNWLLHHGDSPHWSPSAKFVQIDIEPTEFDSNQPIAVPLAGDIGSTVEALNRALDGRPVNCPSDWHDELNSRRERNVASMSARLDEDPRPMRFHNAIRPIREFVKAHPDVYLVNEGANALDVTRNVVEMAVPRHRLDSGTWGVMGIGLGYAIAAAVETGQPVIAVEGDSAFGFSAIEIETICRYGLPVVIVVLNNGGVYRGDETNPLGDAPAPTVLAAGARHELLIEAFGGTGYHVQSPDELAAALDAAVQSRRPALIDCELDSAAGTESGHLTSLNPRSSLQAET
ncbi:MAG: oxalyl-CoA decarboxylase [Mycobacterium sp.]